MKAIPLQGRIRLIPENQTDQDCLQVMRKSDLRVSTHTIRSPGFVIEDLEVAFVIEPTEEGAPDA